MKQHDYQFAPLAERDLEKIQDTLADQYFERDIRFMLKFQQCIDQIRVFPESGRAYKVIGGYRMIPIWDYVMFYKFEDGLIKIERVIHGARNIEAAFYEE